MEVPKNSAHLEPKKAKKRRAPWNKHGKIKYMYRLQRRILDRVSQIEKRQRIILAGLGPFLDVKQDYVMLVVCEDEVDQAILWQLYTAGGQGLLPSVIVDKLSKFNVSRFTVTRRIQRMNKRFQKEFGKSVAKKRSPSGPWAMSSFMRSVYSATVKEAREEEKAAKSKEW